MNNQSHKNPLLAPDEKITTVSEAMQVQNISKQDLLARNEAVICILFLISNIIFYV